MDRIPPEILCVIFLAALPHPTDPREYLSSVVAPLHISHVCRTWRTLSLSFGELWSYLCVKFPTRQSRMKAIVSVFDTWIERTNGGPLNFRVECDCNVLDDTADHRLAEHFVTTMISQQHRWRDVKLTYRDVQFSPEFPGLDLTNMPILTSLALDIMLPLCVKISIAQSSRLRRLYIFVVDFDLIAGDEPPCSLIESAEIVFRYRGYRKLSSSHALRVWLNVLKAAPFMTEFIAHYHLYTDPPPPSRAQNEPLMRLPSLRVLKVEFGPASVIIDYVTLPNLQVLFFSSTRTDEELEAEMLMSFIRRSLPPLTTLVLYWNVREELIIPVLRLLPTLKYLRLHSAIVTRCFFHELTTPGITDANSILGDEHTAVCPVLETIFFDDVDFEEDVDWWFAFIAMLKSRPEGLGKSNVIYLIDKDGDHDVVPTTVEVSLDENTGESQRKIMEEVRGCVKVIIGNYEAIGSLRSKR